MKYVVDIDGTVCKEVGSVIGRTPYIDRINQINKLYDEGHTIVYMTARGLNSGRGDHETIPFMVVKHNFLSVVNGLESRIIRTPQEFDERYGKL
tara:strand:+ start:1199 stop:1480 length:282 start_codon:yes stop_codon:yes gene_type:complete